MPHPDSLSRRDERLPTCSSSTGSRSHDATAKLRQTVTRKLYLVSSGSLPMLVSHPPLPSHPPRQLHTYLASLFSLFIFTFRRLYIGSVEHLRGQHHIPLSLRLEFVSLTRSVHDPVHRACDTGVNAAQTRWTSKFDNSSPLETLF